MGFAKKTKKAVKSASAKTTVKPSASSREPALKRGKDVLSRKNMDGTVAIMRLDNDQFFYTLDGISAEIWEMIDGKMVLSQIKAKIISKLDPPLGRFEKDVQKLIKDLKKEKLLQA